MAAISFYGNQAAACGYMQRHFGMNMIDKSGFNRRLARLQTKLIAVFRALRASLKDFNTSARYMIERSGVPVLSGRCLPKLSHSCQ